MIVFDSGSNIDGAANGVVRYPKTFTPGILEVSASEYGLHTFQSPLGVGDNFIFEVKGLLREEIEFFSPNLPSWRRARDSSNHQMFVPLAAIHAVTPADLRVVVGLWRHGGMDSAYWCGFIALDRSGDGTWLDGEIHTSAAIDVLGVIVVMPPLNRHNGALPLEVEFTFNSLTQLSATFTADTYVRTASISDLDPDLTNVTFGSATLGNVGIPSIERPGSDPDYVASVFKIGNIRYDFTP